ncbi:uncharacterized protein TRIVIDRAFT_48257 [Trichoderma virens Gv29-8]|uniref:Uncharacterized protein n=1 Tax=Hypocrea virens (strain Gv29-8 / FGSC 10586) TaxID=413071 RepID=G9MZC5_HYPVG|nr:uncharacterized protein TRIVIDRAFT_48257 [Trichoderma virens Gv29-8]EHK19982.1 hypothetical protein TRIVIDRAFT_48257 [Trichoderma virens Gv29-8]UKZ46070.1 hypothetical protein TrVGV298_000267 [Trichoderma virens]
MAPRATLRKTIEKKGGKKAASNNAKAALLKMPVELILEFSDAMPTVDKIVFAQTCRPIFNSVGLIPFSKDEEEFREEKFEYLARRSRETLNQWVCEQCLCQHDVDLADTPSRPALNCPVGDLYRSKHNLSLRLISGECYRLGRRHVQLALKYTRLYNETSSVQQQYLRSLMAAHSYSLSYLHKGIKVSQMVKITPRVVDGRFLLKCIFEYRQKAQPIHKEPLFGEFVCQHQSCLGEGEAYYPFSQFNTAVEKALDNKQHEFRSHCHYCCTDFTVKASTHGIRVTVWHDLGTESSALDPVWKASVYSPELYSSDEGLVNNAPGRVRELYDSEE